MIAIKPVGEAMLDAIDRAANDYTGYAEIAASCEVALNRGLVLDLTRDIREMRAALAAVRKTALEWKTAYSMPPLPLDEHSRLMISAADDILHDLGKFATEGSE